MFEIWGFELQICRAWTWNQLLEAIVGHPFSFVVYAFDWMYLRALFFLKKNLRKHGFEMWGPWEVNFFNLNLKSFIGDMGSLSWGGFWVFFELVLVARIRGSDIVNV